MRKTAYVIVSALLFLGACATEVDDFSLESLDAVDLGENTGKDDSPSKATPFNFPDGVGQLTFEPETAGYFSTSLTVPDSNPMVFQLTWTQQDNPGADPTLIPLYVRVTSSIGVKKSAILTTTVGDATSYTYSFALKAYAGQFKLLISTRDNMVAAAKTPAEPPVSAGTFMVYVGENTAPYESELHFPVPAYGCLGTPKYKCSDFYWGAICQSMGCTESTDGEWVTEDGMYRRFCEGTPRPCAGLSQTACPKLEGCFWR